MACWRPCSQLHENATMKLALKMTFFSFFNLAVLVGEKTHKKRVWRLCLMLGACLKELQRVLLGDGRVVEHGHAFDAQQHSQTPRNHVVEDNGAGGERNRSWDWAHNTCCSSVSWGWLFVFFSFSLQATNVVHVGGRGAYCQRAETQEAY